jgi:hypothetical protein
MLLDAADIASSQTRQGPAFSTSGEEGRVQKPEDDIDEL